jgi:hypothetical protein|tara:strand:- start:258 stop:452 length:195 start_codon:yes stop_codon:yes gene_type:complete
MSKNHPLKSPIDGIIIDLILDYYNMQSVQGRKEMLTGDDFNRICEEAEKIYIQQIMITETPGVA